MVNLANAMALNRKTDCMTQRTLLLHDYLDYLADASPNSEFAIFGDICMTYAQAAREANRLAHALHSAGLGKGARFAYLSKNSIDMAIAYLAGSKSGAVPVPLNYRLAPAEWAFIINDSQAKLLIAQSRYTVALDGIRGDIGTGVRRVRIGSGEASEDWIDYHSWLDGQPDDAPHTRGCNRDTLYQMYTSGTTGTPKGAMISQQSLLDNLTQARYSVATPCRRGMRILICTPMYHAAGAIFVAATIAVGACMVIHEDFDPVRVAKDLRTERIAAINVVPAMLQRILVETPDIAEHSYEHLLSISYGAAPIAEETLRRALNVFGCEFYQSFGLTESTAALTVLDDEDHRRALRDRPELLKSCGKPVMGAQLEIVDDGGQPLPSGAVGEILARGPQMMQGYWNLPDATERALKDGWLHTGDVGYLDEEGYLYILDRKKDVIISGAENVYSQEVENVLFGHGDIVDAAVIGVPDEKYGEAVAAFIVARPGCAPTTDEIIAYCRTKLGGYKIPRQVHFVAALPRNASGKVLKKELRAPFWSGRSRQIG